MERPRMIVTLPRRSALNRSACRASVAQWIENMLPCFDIVPSWKNDFLDQIVRKCPYCMAQSSYAFISLQSRKWQPKTPKQYIGFLDTYSAASSGTRRAPGGP